MAAQQHKPDPEELERWRANGWIDDALYEEQQRWAANGWIFHKHA